MNSFGRIFRISILGESHGDYVGILIDGCPAGLSLNNDDFTIDIEGNTSTHSFQASITCEIKIISIKKANIHVCVKMKSR